MSFLIDPSLYEESEVKELEARAFSALEELFEEKTMKRAQGRMSDIALFDMVAMVSFFKVSHSSFQLIFCPIFHVCSHTTV